MPLRLTTDVRSLVKRFRLSSSDFTPADPTIDMLFLIEVQLALLTEARQLIERLNGAKHIAQEEAVTDHLTGLNNHRALARLLMRLEDHAPQKSFTILHIDLDYFKAVNDKYGHDAGDFVLKEVAGRLSGHLRPIDFAARLGGDEFVIVLFNFAEEQKVIEVSHRIIQALEISIVHGENRYNISASIGAAISDWYNPFDAEEILKDADSSLYAAKSEGRGCVILG